MITPIVTNHRKEISQLCQRFNVRTLEVFGSATTPLFDAERSDLDFIVSFADESFGTLADRYLDLAEALEKIFERPVDLLTQRSLRNPYFIQEVNQTRQTIYEQPGS